MVENARIDDQRAPVLFAQAFDRERADRERASYTYVKWTFWAAVAAAFIGVVGVIMTVYLAR